MANVPVPNGSFEQGDFSSWTVLQGNPGQINVTSVDRAPYEGTYGLAVRSNGEIVVQNDTFFDVVPGDSITVSCYIMPTRGSDRGTVRVWWFDETNSPITPAYTENPHNTPGHIQGTGGYRRSPLTNISVPAAARKFKVGFYARKYTESAFGVDFFQVDVSLNRTITLISPADSSEWAEGDTIPFMVQVGGDAPPVVSVDYLVNTDVVGTVPNPPYSYNYLNAQPGTYNVQARLNLQGGFSLLSNINTFEVTEVPPPPVTEPREYNASNSYTNLVLENFAGLSSSIPSTALVTGAEVILDYKLSVLSRTKDINIEDPENANDLAPFDIVQQIDTYVSLLDTVGGYSVRGSPESASTTIIHTDFPIVETGISEDKKWTVRENDSIYSVLIGSENFLWGQAPMAFADFVSKGLGIKFIPRVGTKPAYADSGDAVFRVFLDRVRLRVYFDAGSVEYYFASPDKTQVIKGRLVSSYVLSGNFETGDAGGVLQLTPELEVMDGTQTWIGDDWTIHSAYPPTDANQIGEVDSRETDDGIGMSYNGLPTHDQIVDNRSRYVFITANFYGDRELNSIYGVNGLPRAFSYNGDFFYKIYTQSDPVKDSPRHVGYHHGHLALGFNGGRVDISVVGEPYNFDGAEGASSWAIGDGVVGLLPLSGTILGVFCSKSVWGISGTTVDNFATQVIAPKMGAIEYTVTDMGFPVYANAYGIYTLAQTQEYGDYLGTPMSQDISPWLRPRLVRKYVSDKEVVVAWPARAKNQYRLCFNDGYVLSMTINNGQQGAPTFSKQKYFISDICDTSYTFTSFDGGDNTTVTRTGDTVSIVPSGIDASQGFTAAFSSPKSVILNVDSITWPWNGFAGLVEVTTSQGTSQILNEDSTGTAWLPNPINLGEDVLEFTYYSATGNSDTPFETSSITIQVECQSTVPDNLLEQKAIVPIAVSSELDDSGEERIHLAPYLDTENS